MLHTREEGRGEEENFQNRVDEIKSLWRDVIYSGTSTAEQQNLETILAIHLAMSSGRADLEEMRKASGRKLPLIQASRENHRMLAKISTVLLKKLHPDMELIKRSIGFISDFDLLDHEHPPVYKGEFQGALKFQHEDFAPLRAAIQNYSEQLKENQKFRSQVFSKYTRSVGDLGPEQFLKDARWLLGII